MNLIFCELFRVGALGATQDKSLSLQFAIVNRDWIVVEFVRAGADGMSSNLDAMFLVQWAEANFNVLIERLG